MRRRPAGAAPLTAVLCILAALVTASCSTPEDYDPRFEEVPTLGAGNPEEIGAWLSTNIQYTDDASVWEVEEYYQSPAQTYAMGTGDCDDYAIFMMYVIHVELGGWPEFVYGTYAEANHCWISWNGRMYESQMGLDVTDDASYVEDGRLSYGDVLRRSTTTHRGLRAGAGGRGGTPR